MRPIYNEVEGAANGVPIPLDTYISPFNVSLAVSIESGAIDATVEYTFDDVFDPDVVPAWVPHSSLTGLTAAADATLISPVAAVRLVNADTGTAKLTVRQAGAA